MNLRANCNTSPLDELEVFLKTHKAEALDMESIETVKMKIAKALDEIAQLRNGKVAKTPLNGFHIGDNRLITLAKNTGLPFCVLSKLPSCYITRLDLLRYLLMPKSKDDKPTLSLSQVLGCDNQALINLMKLGSCIPARYDYDTVCRLSNEETLREVDELMKPRTAVTAGV